MSIILIAAVINLLNEHYLNTKNTAKLSMSPSIIVNKVDYYTYEKNQLVGHFFAENINIRSNLDKIVAKQVEGDFESLKTSFKAEWMYFDQATKNISVFNVSEGKVDYLIHLKTQQLIIDLDKHSLTAPYEFEAYENSMNFYLRADNLYYDGKKLLEINKIKN